MTAALSTDFASLPLPPHVLENLARLGYTSMTPIQAAALPSALGGKDLIAQARTGQRQDGGLCAGAAGQPEHPPPRGSSPGALPHA